MNAMIQKVSHCPSCGRCYHCAKTHVVMTSDTEGVGVICRWCWDILETPAKLQIHLRHWLNGATWRERFRYTFGFACGWERVQDALNRVQEWRGYCQTCGKFRRVPIGEKRDCPDCERPLMERRKL